MVTALEACSTDYFQGDAALRELILPNTVWFACNIQHAMCRVHCTIVRLFRPCLCCGCGGVWWLCFGFRSQCSLCAHPCARSWSFISYSNTHKPLFNDAHILKTNNIIKLLLSWYLFAFPWPSSNLLLKSRTIWIGIRAIDLLQSIVPLQLLEEGGSK